MKKIVFSVLLIGIVVSTSVGAYLSLNEVGQRASASIPPATTIVSQNKPNPNLLALNAFIDASGVKQELEGSLYSNSGVIAQHLGITESQVDTAIGALDIQHWEVAELPGDATVSNNVAIDYEGTNINVTTYTDTSYVTVGVRGQALTFAVPESAQGSVSLLSQLA